MASLDEIRLQQLLGTFEQQPQGIATLSQAASPLSFRYTDQLYPQYGTSDMGYAIGPYGNADTISGVPTYGYAIQPSATPDSFLGSGFSGTPDMNFPFAPANRLGGLNLEKFQGVSELGRQDEDVEQVEYLPGQEPSGIEKLFNKVQSIPGAVKSGLLSLIGKVNPALSFIGGGLSSIINLPKFFQERRDARARAEAAERGAAKQQEMARQTAFQAMRGNDAYGGGGGRPGGFGQGAGDFSASDPTATEGSF